MPGLLCFLDCRNTRTIHTVNLEVNNQPTYSLDNHQYICRFIGTFADATFLKLSLYSKRLFFYIPFSFLNAFVRLLISSAFDNKNIIKPSNARKMPIPIGELHPNIKYQSMAPSFCTAFCGLIITHKHRDVCCDTTITIQAERSQLT